VDKGAAGVAALTRAQREGGTVASWVKMDLQPLLSFAGYGSRWMERWLGREQQYIVGWAGLNGNEEVAGERHPG